MPAEKGPGAGGKKDAPRNPKARTTTTRRAARSGASKTSGRASLPGVGSASGGTILVAAVSKLPDSNPYKSWLLLVAPALTVGVLVVWTRLIAWAEERSFQSAAERADKQARERLERDFREAREAIDAALKNDRISDEAKSEFLKKREDLERLFIEIRVAKVRLHVED